MPCQFFSTNIKWKQQVASDYGWNGYTKASSNNINKLIHTQNKPIYLHKQNLVTKVNLSIYVES